MCGGHSGAGDPEDNEQVRNRREDRVELLRTGALIPGGPVRSR